VMNQLVVDLGFRKVSCDESGVVCSCHVWYLKSFYTGCL
jgi:hypothetical protein